MKWLTDIFSRGSKPEPAPEPAQDGAALFGYGGSSFDAASHSPRRSPVPGASPTDFKHEFSGGNRLEIVKRSRYLMKNSGLPREVRDLNVLYGVGPEGVWPHPLVESRQWAKDAVTYFKDWGQRACDITERFSFPEIEKLCSQAIDTDGEIFVVKTRNRLTGEPRLQLIETHRVGNFLDYDTDGTSDKWIDGIRVDPFGRGIAIKVLLDNGKTRNIPMGAVMHVFDPESPSAYRHPPLLTHSINHLLDEIELLALEKHAVKDNADITRVLKSRQGKFDQTGDFSAAGDLTTEEEGETSDPKKLQRITGGKIVAIYPDEDLSPYEAKRPSPVFTGFLDHLGRDSTMGAAPYEFVVNAKGATSPQVRLAIAKFQRRAKNRTNVLKGRLIRGSWFYVIGDAIDRGILPPIKDWSKIDVTPPRDVTVDAGRESEANRRDVEAGLKLPSTSYEEMGHDFIEKMEEKAQLIKLVEDIARREGIPPSQLFNFETRLESDARGSAGTAPSGGGGRR